VSLRHFHTQVCAQQRAMLHTDSHFQPATQYLLFTAPTCFGHNKMEVQSLCTMARHTENV